ncbi:MAG: PAS domain-containing protein [Rhodospirillaceae bacterium]
MFKTEDARAFFAAWQEIAPKDKIPHYRDIFDRLPSAFFPELTIMEVRDDGQFTLRFMGTHLVDTWGQDLTDTDTFSILSPAVARSFRQNAEQILNHPCGMRSMTVTVNAQGHQSDVERVLLPVGNDPDRPPRIVCFNSHLPLSDFTSPDGKILESRDHSWLDIGFGVPAEAPAVGAPSAG